MDRERFENQDQPENHKKGSFIFSIILATGLAAGCVVSKQKPETTPVRTYTTPKSQEIVKERRPLYLCSADIDELKNLESQCSANIKRYKEAGLNCIRCDREVEVLK